MTRPRTVLVVDDERTIADVVARYLEREGYRALVAHDGEQAVALAERERPDLVVLDVMLPRIDGLQVMAVLRRRRPTPVILLTARGEEQERVSGLRLGADDYVVKPFSPAELVARVGAVLRRLAGAAGDGAAGELLEFGDVTIDEAARSCTVRGRPAELTAKEFELLLHLARNPGRAFSRDDLMDAVWRYPYYSNTATVTVHVRRVRHKIEEDPLHPRHLVTVWGVGYKLVP
jgi:DNA-binding response OmpR family regulator